MKRIILLLLAFLAFASAADAAGMIFRRLEPETIAYSTLAAGNNPQARAINDNIRAIKYASGLSIAGATGYISTAAGNSYLTGLSVDLRPYVMTPGWKFTVTDGTYTAVGYGKSPGSGSGTTTEIWKTDAAVFTSGTYSWAAQGTNTIANNSNELKITYVNNAVGAKVMFSSSADLNENLVPGLLYEFRTNARVNAGSSVNISLWTGSSSFIVGIVSATSKTAFGPGTFNARSATSAYVQTTSMQTGEIVWVDDLSLLKRTAPNYTGVTITDTARGSTYSWTSNTGLYLPTSMTITITRE